MHSRFSERVRSCESNQTAFLWEDGKDNHKMKEMYLIMLKLFVRCVNNCGNLEDIRFTQLLKG